MKRMIGAFVILILEIIWFILTGVNEIISFFVSKLPSFGAFLQNANDFYYQLLNKMTFLPEILKGSLGLISLILLINIVFFSIYFIVFSIAAKIGNKENGEDVEYANNKQNITIDKALEIIEPIPSVYQTKDVSNDMQFEVKKTHKKFPKYRTIFACITSVVFVVFIIERFFWAFKGSEDNVLFLQPFYDFIKPFNNFIDKNIIDVLFKFFAADETNLAKNIIASNFLNNENLYIVDIVEPIWWIVCFIILELLFWGLFSLIVKTRNHKDGKKTLESEQSQYYSELQSSSTEDIESFKREEQYDNSVISKKAQELVKFDSLDLAKTEADTITNIVSLEEKEDKKTILNNANYIDDISDGVIDLGKAKAEDKIVVHEQKEKLIEDITTDLKDIPILKETSTNNNEDILLVEKEFENDEPVDLENLECDTIANVSSSIEEPIDLVENIETININDDIVIPLTINQPEKTYEEEDFVISSAEDLEESYHSTENNAFLQEIKILQEKVDEQNKKIEMLIEQQIALKEKVTNLPTTTTSVINDPVTEDKIEQKVETKEESTVEAIIPKEEIKEVIKQKESEEKLKTFVESEPKAENISKIEVTSKPVGPISIIRNIDNKQIQKEAEVKRVEVLKPSHLNSKNEKITPVKIGSLKEAGRQLQLKKYRSNFVMGGKLSPDEAFLKSVTRVAPIVKPFAMNQKEDDSRLKLKKKKIDISSLVVREAPQGSSVITLNEPTRKNIIKPIIIESNTNKPKKPAKPINIKK